MSASGGTSPALDCQQLTVAYDAEPVLRRLNLSVRRGETVALLGPSGSGKTTLLYTVAGFVKPTAGEIAIAGIPVSSSDRDAPPEDRGVGMVFQHYALWPHLSAMDTVAYALRRGGMSGRQANRRALDLLEVMGLAHLASRRPAELSGGQQQRVGLARALARDAGLYLFDEPTAHLDTPLRTTLQAEMTQRQHERGAAALYATHDAGEALAVADRVALLRDGQIVQVGTPADIYERPVDLWAARLTGPASVLEVEVAGLTDTKGHLRVAGGQIMVDMVDMVDGGTVGSPVSGRHTVLVRPDWATLGGPLVGRVAHVWYRGPHTDYLVQSSSGDVVIRCAGPPQARLQERVNWRLHRIHPLRSG